jgi:hypothetical protein
MADLNVLETRGYTTAFFDGGLPATAHNYETTKSDSMYHAAGVVTGIDDKNITFELRNEIRAGDEITFLLPRDKFTLKLDKIINAKNGTEMPKMSAGQGNACLISRELIPAQYLPQMEKYILAYKHK